MVKQNQFQSFPGLISSQRTDIQGKENLSTLNSLFDTGNSVTWVLKISNVY